jgi:threonine dehydratase
MNPGVKQTLLAKVYDVAIESPLTQAPKLSFELNCNVYLKREDLQPVNSFKLRGAYNKIASLSRREKSRGVIAASAGNHAQGVALSAQKLGLSALIVMPITTPEIKIQAVKALGAKVVLYGDSYSEAYEHCQSLTSKTGRVFIHPFDDPLVIAGQGTIGREILEQLPTVTHIFVPIGGGGLIAGIAQYTKQLQPKVKIIGVESSDSNSMQMSLKNGRRVSLPHVGIFADGVAVKQVGELSYKITQEFVDEVITVSTDQICAAIKQIFEETRSIVEPAGALSTAGLKSYSSSRRLKDKQLVAICSGANMTFERLQFVAERTLVGSGREALFAVELPERPGALQHFCEHALSGHNITEFNYRLKQRGRAHIFVGIGVSNLTDKKMFMANMKKNGYKYTDLSADDLAKEHIRHMIGGPSPEAQNEYLYEISFPERPGALKEFLRTLGQANNICLFHYRGQGGDEGRVLIGFETENCKELEAALASSHIQYKPVHSPAANIFLH